MASLWLEVTSRCGSLWTEDASRPGTRQMSTWGGREIPLAQGDTLIGRDPECTVRIDSPTVSRRHALIRVRGASATIEDLGSKNGTKIGARLVEGVTPLSDGDGIVIGPAKLLFWAMGAGSTETAAGERDEG